VLCPCRTHLCPPHHASKDLCPGRFACRGFFVPAARQWIATNSPASGHLVGHSIACPACINRHNPVVGMTTQPRPSPAGAFLPWVMRRCLARHCLGMATVPHVCRHLCGAEWFCSCSKPRQGLPHNGRPLGGTEPRLSARSGLFLPRLELLTSPDGLSGSPTAAPPSQRARVSPTPWASAPAGSLARAFFGHSADTKSLRRVRIGILSAKPLILWCGRRESNPHGDYPSGF
jgi:hypothetical protein